MYVRIFGYLQGGGIVVAMLNIKIGKGRERREEKRIPENCSMSAN